jgi:DNA segregation ATPase FtsK/SpoIIIE-like protein
MKSHGVFRYASTEEYISILSKLNQEMEKRQEIFQTDSNIITYNKNNPQKAMKEVIIVINEVLALFSSINSKDAKTIADLLINLLSKGA